MLARAAVVNTDWLAGENTGGSWHEALIGGWLRRSLANEVS